MFKPGGERWEMLQGAIRVRVHVEMDAAGRAVVRGAHRAGRGRRGCAYSLRSWATKRALYPQEFLALIAEQERFDFVGWWNQWNLAQPITATMRLLFRPIALLRRI